MQTDVDSSSATSSNPTSSPPLSHSLTTIPKHGELLTLHQLLLHRPQFGSAFRVFGKLAEYDPVEGVGLLEHKGHSLLVDLRLVERVQFRQNGLWQLIGELVQDETIHANGDKSNKVLRVRWARNVDGMDLGLYENVIGLLQDFLASSSSSSSSSFSSTTAITTQQS